MEVRKLPGSKKNTDIVVKSNPLIEANYKLGTMEQKIILTLASKINRDDKEFHTYTLKIKEFCSMLGIKPNNNYTELKEITMNLMKKTFQIQFENKTVQVSWLSYVAYNDQGGTIEMRFDPFLKPFLLEIKKNFTYYELVNVVHLRSSYSIRIYELLKRYQGLKHGKIFSIDELRKKLGAEDSYPLYANFKQRIVIASQKELEKKTDICFTFEEIKVGRKVDAICFHIQENPKNAKKSVQSTENFGKNSDRKKIYELLTNTSITASNVLIDKWLQYGIDRVAEVIIYASNPNSGVEDPIRFISWALKNDAPLSNIISAKKGTDKKKRTEMLPDWFKQDEQNVQQKCSEEDIDLIEQRKMLEEELRRYKKTKPNENTLLPKQ